jgi:hypothetical protein
MKELLASISGAETDKLAEAKGIDWNDRRDAKEMAATQTFELAESRYQGRTGWE